MSQLKDQILRKRNHRASFTSLIITMIEIKEVAIVEAEAVEVVEAGTTIIITTTTIIEISIAITMLTTIMILITIESTTDQNMMINLKEEIVIITSQITLQIESFEETGIKKGIKITTLGGTRITTTITTITTTTIITIIETSLETTKQNRRLLQSNQKSRNKFKQSKKQL